MYPAYNTLLQLLIFFVCMFYLIHMIERYYSVVELFGSLRLFVFDNKCWNTKTAY